MANSVVHFEIFASDMEQTRRFYEQVFGWHFEVGGPPDFYPHRDGLALNVD
jgi:predicted enzyme related to lactoylglutathione lyase